MQSDLSEAVLIQICTRASIIALEKLAQTPLWLDIREFASSNHFWFLRVQVERQEQLHWRTDISWRDIAVTIDQMLRRGVMSSECASVPDLIERFCLETRTPSVKDFSLFQCCCASGAVSLIRELLASEYLQPVGLLHYPFNMACSLGHAGVVRLLLEDGRIDVTRRDWRCLRDACTLEHTEVVKAIVQDKRYDWTWHRELVIQTAEICEDRELLEIAARKGLIRWPIRPLSVVMAILMLLTCL